MKHSKIFSEERGRDIEIIRERYNFYKKQIDQPWKNQHFTNCTWSGDNSHNQETSNDFCGCYYMQRFPSQLCSEIVDIYGFEYMLKC